MSKVRKSRALSSLKPLSRIQVTPKGVFVSPRAGKAPVVHVHARSRGKPVQLLVGVGKNSFPISFDVGLSKSQMQEAVPTLLKELDKEAYKIPRIMAAWRYAVFPNRNSVRSRNFRKVKWKPLTKPLRVTIPAAAAPLVKYFDRIADESRRADFSGKLKRAISISRKLGEKTDTRTWSDDFVRRDVPAARLPSAEQEILRYVADKSFVVKDSALFATVLKGVANQMIARAILDRFRTRLGEKKYRETVSLLENHFRKQLTGMPIQDPVPVYRFIRKIRSRNPEFVQYDYFPPRIPNRPVRDWYAEPPPSREFLSDEAGLQRYGSRKDFEERFQKAVEMLQNPRGLLDREMAFRLGMMEGEFDFYRSRLWNMTRNHFDQLTELYRQNPRATIRDVEKTLGVNRAWARWTREEYTRANPAQRYTKYSEEDARAAVEKIVQANPRATPEEVQRAMNVSLSTAYFFLDTFWYPRILKYFRKNPLASLKKIAAALNMSEVYAKRFVKSFRTFRYWTLRREARDKVKEEREKALLAQLDEGALERLAAYYMQMGNRAVVNDFAAYCRSRKIPIGNELASRVLRVAVKWREKERRENELPF